MNYFLYELFFPLSAGLFPGKCFSLPAREITLEELQRVS